MKNTKTSSFLALLASAVIYASFGVLIRELDKSFGVYFQITARSVVAVAILGLILLATKTSLRIKRTELVRTAAFAISFPITIILFTVAVLNINIASAVLLLYGGSLLSSLLIGTFFFKEKLNTQKIISIILVVIGLAIFTQVWLGIAVGFGFVLSLLSGIADGITNSIRKAVKDLPRNTLLFYQYSTCIILSFALALITGEQLVTDWAVGPVIVAVVFGLLIVLIGRLLMYGFAHTDVNIATVTLASELLFSVLFGLIFLHERPAIHELIGGIIIFAASVLSGLDLKRLRKKLS